MGGGEVLQSTLQNRSEFGQVKDTYGSSSITTTIIETILSWNVLNAELNYK